ncbi:sodium-dependent glucose transporter 1A-like [Ptychodera flava]|uniref:sodium-dependent glucose transporter 1A-like n=1 Tax=Ptychodera flava TaxID=63121 RepID=UPI00396A7A7D
MDVKEEVKVDNQEEIDRHAQIDLLTDSVEVKREDTIDDTYSDHKQSHRLLRTLPLFMASMGLGMYAAILGPSFPDFQWTTGVHIDRIVMIVVFVSVGFAVGTLTSGVCYDTFNNDLVMALSLVSSSVVIAPMSLCQSLPLLLTISVLTGIADGFIETGTYSICVKIWRRDCHIYVQALQFSYALGATLSPLLASPFLIEMDNNNGTHITSALTSSVNPPLQGSNLSLILQIRQSIENDSYKEVVDHFGRMKETDEFQNKDCGLEPACAYKLNRSLYNLTQQDANDREPSNGNRRRRVSKIWIPYTILSCYMIIISPIYFIFFFKGNRTLKITKPATADQTDDEDSRNKARLSMIVLIILLCAFSALAISTHLIYGMFIYTYAINMNLGFTTKTASYLTSLFWGCFAASRGMSIFEAKFLSPKTMIIIDLVGLVFTTTLLAAFGGTVPEVLWVVTCFHGIFSAPLFGCGITWAEQYIKLTGKITSFTLVGVAVASTSLPLILGKLFTVHGYDTFAYMMVAISGVTIAVFIIMQKVASGRGKRYRQRRIEDIDLTSVEDIS